ncbi:MAG: hypothetical protein ACXVC6_09255 [Bacteroidia bacterium]
MKKENKMLIISTIVKRSLIVATVFFSMLFTSCKKVQPVRVGHTKTASGFAWQEDHGSLIIADSAYWTYNGQSAWLHLTHGTNKELKLYLGDCSAAPLSTHEAHMDPPGNGFFYSNNADNYMILCDSYYQVNVNSDNEVSIHFDLQISSNTGTIGMVSANLIDVPFKN